MSKSCNPKDVELCQDHQTVLETKMTTTTTLEEIKVPCSPVTDNATFVELPQPFSLWFCTIELNMSSIRDLCDLSERVQLSYPTGDLAYGRALIMQVVNGAGIYKG